MKFTHSFKTQTPIGNVICAEIWLDPDTNWGGGYEIWDEATGGNRIYVEGALETEVDSDPQGGNEVHASRGTMDASNSLNILPMPSKRRA
jgi:hypothetical protein